MNYTINQIREKLQSDARWTERAIIRLYERQTADEQRSEDVKYRNGVGFSGADVKRLSYYARWILSGRHLSGNHLSKAQKAVAKYAGQVQEMINQNAQN